MTTLKVLPNDLQSSIEIRQKFAKSRGKEIEGDVLDPIVGSEGYARRFPPVFSRVGYYLKGPLCWWEFQLEDGSFISVEADKKMFLYTLMVKNGGEFCIREDELKALDFLLSRGIIKPPKWYEGYQTAAYHKRMGLDMRRRFLPFRKKIKAAKDAKRETSE